MENCEYNNKIELKKSIVPFVIGMILTVATVIMFFVGAFGGSQGALWIATAVSGALALVFLAFSTFTTDGWMRMFSILFIVAITVMITFMATITWA